MPPRGTRLERQLAKETAAREQAEALLAQARRSRPLELKALRADNTRTERELRGQLRQLRTQVAEAQQQAATVAGELKHAHAGHQAQLAELQEDHRAQVANLEHDHGQVLAELEEGHAAELERLAEAPAAKRATEAEAKERTARQQLQETTRRLEGELGELRQSSAARVEEFREQLRGARHELTEQQAHATGLQALLDQTQAAIAQLEERLAPKAPQRAVVVRWLRDSDPAGHWVGDFLAKGKGPRYGRQDIVAPGGALTKPLLSPGEVMLVPEAAAIALAQSGFVQVLSDSELPYRKAPGAARTAEDLRGQATWLQAQAAELEQAQQQHTAPAASS